MPSRFSANHTFASTVHAVVGGLDPRDLALEVLVASLPPAPFTVELVT
jgi:hypothetical protein